MNRPITNSLGQIIGKRQSVDPRRMHLCRIDKVLYTARRLKVSAHGYSGPSKVAVQYGIPLGTEDNPIVTTNNLARIELQNDGKWLCTDIRRKLVCATGGQSQEVEADNEFERISSFQTDGFGSLVTPDFTFNPPLEGLGMFTLPNLRFPDPTQYFCGKPQCTNCSPGGLLSGMTLVLSSDAEHPDGCWIWDFRTAGCTASSNPAELGEADYADNTFTSTQMTVVGNYAYMAISRFNGDASGTADINVYVLDVSDPTTPVVVGSDTFLYTFAGGSGFAANVETAGVTKNGNYLYIPVVYSASSGFADDTTLVVRVDVSDPTNPFFEWTGNIQFSNILAIPTGFEAFINTGDSTINAITLWREDVMSGLPDFGLAVVELGSTFASTRNTFVASDPVDGWDNFAFVQQIFFGIGNVGDIDIVDITDPDSISTINNFDTGYPIIRSIAVAFDLTQMWVGVTDNGVSPEENYLLAYDITDLTSPVLLSSTLLGTGNTNRITHIVLCAKDKLFLTHGSGSRIIKTYDITDPTSPSNTGSVTVSGFNLLQLQLYSSYLYANGVETPGSQPELHILG